jgi:hypothetical protein
MKIVDLWTAHHSPFRADYFESSHWDGFEQINLFRSGHNHGYDLSHTNQANISVGSTISAPLIARQENIRAGHSHFEYMFQKMIGSATIIADTRRTSKKLNRSLNSSQNPAKYRNWAIEARGKESPRPPACSLSREKCSLVVILRDLSQETMAFC